MMNGQVRLEGLELPTNPSFKESISAPNHTDKVVVDAGFDAELYIQADSRIEGLILEEIKKFDDSPVENEIKWRAPMELKLEEEMKKFDVEYGKNEIVKNNLTRINTLREKRDDIHLRIDNLKGELDSDYHVKVDDFFQKVENNLRDTTTDRRRTQIVKNDLVNDFEFGSFPLRIAILRFGEDYVKYANNRFLEFKDQMKTSRKNRSNKQLANALSEYNQANEELTKLQEENLKISNEKSGLMTTLNSVLSNQIDDLIEQKRNRVQLIFSEREKKRIQEEDEKKLEKLVSDLAFNGKNRYEPVQVQEESVYFPHEEAVIKEDPESEDIFDKLQKKFNINDKMGRKLMVESAIKRNSERLARKNRGEKNVSDDEDIDMVSSSEEEGNERDENVQDDTAITDNNKSKNENSPLFSPDGPSDKPTAEKSTDDIPKESPKLVDKTAFYIAAAKAYQENQLTNESLVPEEESNPIIKVKQESDLFMNKLRQSSQTPTFSDDGSDVLELFPGLISTVDSIKTQNGQIKTETVTMQIKGRAGGKLEKESSIMDEVTDEDLLPSKVPTAKIKVEKDDNEEEDLLAKKRSYSKLESTSNKQPVFPKSVSRTTSREHDIYIPATRRVPSAERNTFQPHIYPYQSYSRDPRVSRDPREPRSPRDKINQRDFRGVRDSRDLKETFKAKPLYERPSPYSQYGERPYKTKPSYPKKPNLNQKDKGKYPTCVGCGIGKSDPTTPLCGRCTAEKSSKQTPVENLQQIANPDQPIIPSDPRKRRKQ